MSETPEWFVDDVGSWGKDRDGNRMNRRDHVRYIDSRRGVSKTKERGREETGREVYPDEENRGKSHWSGYRSEVCVRPLRV